MTFQNIFNITCTKWDFFIAKLNFKISNPPSLLFASLQYFQPLHCTLWFYERFVDIGFQVFSGKFFHYL